ncbi:efflux transporter periplasmic adaptor subunit, partial [Rhizobium ruizarguesonis]
SGILQQRIFEPGSLVQQGAVLYRIDPTLFRVRVASAEASVARSKATQLNARLQLDRQKSLRDRDVASGIEYDAAAVAL